MLAFSLYKIVRVKIDNLDKNEVYQEPDGQENEYLEKELDSLRNAENNMLSYHGIILWGQTYPIHFKGALIFIFSSPEFWDEEMKQSAADLVEKIKVCITCMPIEERTYPAKWKNSFNMKTYSHDWVRL